MAEITELREYRKGRGTLEGVAHLFGVNKTTWLRWEKGEFPIPAKRLSEIEKATGISRQKLRPDIFTEAAS